MPKQYYRIYDIASPIFNLEVKHMYENEELTCCHHGTHPRMFLTTEEKIEHLTKYKEWLQNETKGVDEAIANLKKP